MSVKVILEVKVESIDDGVEELWTDCFGDLTQTFSGLFSHALLSPFEQSSQFTDYLTELAEKNVEGEVQQYFYSGDRKEDFGLRCVIFLTASTLSHQQRSQQRQNLPFQKIREVCFLRLFLFHLDQLFIETHKVSADGFLLVQLVQPFKKVRKFFLTRAFLFL